MTPTKKVPAAFHSELSEYASLLRTLRTNSTLDFVPQLSKSQFVHEGVDDSPDSEDTWTLWPLLLEHCAVPEWGLDEEVKTIAEHSLRTHESNHGTSISRHVHQSHTEGLPSGEADDDLDQLALSPAHLSGLNSDVSSKLSSLLSLLALHRSNVNFTKHGRVNPMKWEDIMEVAAASELFDKRVIEDVMSRMEDVFGPSGSEAVRHMEVLEASKRALEAAHAVFGQDVSTLTGPPPPKKSRRGKRKREADKYASGNDKEDDAKESS